MDADKDFYEYLLKISPLLNIPESEENSELLWKLLRSYHQKEMSTKMFDLFKNRILSNDNAWTDILNNLSTQPKSGSDPNKMATDLSGVLKDYIKSSSEPTDDTKIVRDLLDNVIDLMTKKLVTNLK